jgi:acyl-coenzyme A thioesterase PaaI-like protein
LQKYKTEHLKSFSIALKNRLKLEELRKGHIVMSFVVDNSSINLYETLHGGAFCFLAGNIQKTSC